ncbi:Chloride channel CLIC-like protein 1 Precursor [Channa argus]|uniref:Chloride channel CLIC-like protein 1 n=2 Tax=Channa argus TaxID=215402 RepID=A0A6G1PKJ7_CHAAH|nr:Chloride channel CLIC-like protein 1 Precursor [Channa argus]
MGSWESASTLCARMLRVVLACSLSLALMGQQVEDDWVDPYDMLNYDATTKTMRKPTETANYNNVATKRREYTQDSCQAQLASCSRHVEDLQRQMGLCVLVFMAIICTQLWSTASWFVQFHRLFAVCCFVSII